MRLVACDLCGSLQATPVCTQRDPLASCGTPIFRIVESRGCGLLYLNPRAEGPTLAANYPDYYYDSLAFETDHARPRHGTAREIHRDIRRDLLDTVYGYPRAEGDRVPGCVVAAGVRLERWRLRVSGREASIISFVGDARLLDVGCGTGKDLERFQQAGWHVTGVEMSPYAASLARARPRV